ncbi:hypothetical protein P22_1161 [Propionispora sp. 2/2-37]|uniref:class I SAM-dependent methyltransferase n=1 Tax=Propionispora sp. 2/2-37 TaxID=1677858 RepID=UPI0006BB5D59|nr:class I SAM-dependent methyltransferase [Propionispora sp. 2/2-37]CUH95092.1 hypothetical protein P22_1161 [Propionispora sp. 2/2-37]
MKRRCRCCGALLEQTFVDLGLSPLANQYITREQLNHKEILYPLHVFVCHHCFLVQLEEMESPEHIFSEYAYFSSCSQSWLKHAENYAETVINRFGLNGQSQIIEIASNDGYLLQYFQKKKIPVTGIEPAGNVAMLAQNKGIPTWVRFFGQNLAQELVDQGISADLLIGNNVLAHVPDLHDFIKGMKTILKLQGVITVEFPHLLQLMQHNQFDTIYHEHFSYFSLEVVKRMFATHGLSVFDVEEIDTHGGSLRIYACHQGCSLYPIRPSVENLCQTERVYGLQSLWTYRQFEELVKKTKRDILTFLIQCRESGRHIVGYGAPAKGNTLLNYCGIRSDFLEYTVDCNPYKQGKYLPGTRIPIVNPERIYQTQPEYVWILPWNLREEIAGQMRGIRDWGGKFFITIPQVQVF